MGRREVKVSLPSYGEVKVYLREPTFGEVMDILGEMASIDPSTGNVAKKQVNMLKLGIRLFRVMFDGSDPEIPELREPEKLPVKDGLALALLALQNSPF